MPRGTAWLRSQLTLTGFTTITHKLPSRQCRRSFSIARRYRFSCKAPSLEPIIRHCHCTVRHARSRQRFDKNACNEPLLPVMRALAFWGVCPETGPAGFSGRTLSTCDCPRVQRHTACRQSAHSSLQQPGPDSSNTYRQQTPERSQARAATLTWPEDWQEPEGSYDPEATQQPNQSWDNGFFSPVQTHTERKKPLKINQDLLLVSLKLLSLRNKP